jgi:hypothetical protein
MPSNSSGGGAPTAEGVLHFSFEINVNLREMRDWPPQCIRQFFDGIARAREAVNFAREINRV